MFEILHRLFILFYAFTGVCLWVVWVSHIWRRMRQTTSDKWQLTLSGTLGLFVWPWFYIYIVALNEQRKAAEKSNDK